MMVEENAEDADIIAQINELLERESELNSTIEALNAWLAALNETGITEIYKGYGGVDISFLKEAYPDITLVGLVPNPENYFKYHHTAEDVLENVSKQELEAGSAALANLIYLVDSKGILAE